MCFGIALGSSNKARANFCGFCIDWEHPGNFIICATRFPPRPIRPWESRLGLCWGLGKASWCQVVLFCENFGVIWRPCWDLWGLHEGILARTLLPGAPQEPPRRRSRKDCSSSRQKRCRSHQGEPREPQQPPLCRRRSPCSRCR